MGSVGQTLTGLVGAWALPCCQFGSLGYQLLGLGEMSPLFHYVAEEILRVGLIVLLLIHGVELLLLTGFGESSLERVMLCWRLLSPLMLNALCLRFPNAFITIDFLSDCLSRRASSTHLVLLLLIPNQLLQWYGFQMTVVIARLADSITNAIRMSLHVIQRIPPLQICLIIIQTSVLIALYKRRQARKGGFVLPQIDLVIFHLSHMWLFLQTSLELKIIGLNVIFEVVDFDHGLVLMFALAVMFYLCVMVEL